MPHHAAEVELEQQGRGRKENAVLHMQSMLSPKADANVVFPPEGLQLQVTAVLTHHENQHEYFATTNILVVPGMSP